MLGFKVNIGDEGFELELPDELKKRMEDDPELVKFVQSLTEIMRLAVTKVQDGVYSDINDAIESITGIVPNKLGNNAGYIDFDMDRGKKLN